MVQVVSRRLLDVESRDRSHVGPREICGGQMALGQVSPRVLRLSPVSNIPQTLYTHISSIC
jgi:hypothetical protein